MRYRLRTLLIVLAIGPPMLAAVWLYPSLPLTVLHAVLGLAPMEVLLLICFWNWYRHQPKSE